MNSPPRPHRPRPASRLIAHEIRFRRKEHANGHAAVVASVECERRKCDFDVNECAYCERFARIEMHEAGYTLLCRSTDEEE
jgi:hypothetical protein